MESEDHGRFCRIILGLLLGTGCLALMGCESMPKLPFPSTSPQSNAQDTQQKGNNEEGPPRSITTRGPKKRIAVLPFEVKAGNTYSYSRVDVTAAEMLTTELFKTGEFIV